MSAAFHFGRSIKRAFYVSPDMFASGNFGTVMPPKKKKKKKSPFDDTRETLDKAEKEYEDADRKLNEKKKQWPDKPGPLPQKSAAYFFGAWMKQAQNPGQIPSGTLSLNNPGQLASPSITVSGGTQGPNTGMTGAPKPSGLPQAPTRSWGGYLTDTNNGLAKDVGDYFTHFIPQNTMPWTDAWKSAPERYKNLPVDRALGQASTAAAGLGLAAGTAAVALPAVAPGLASMPLFGSGGAAAGTVAGGVGAGSQTPAGQQALQRGTQIASQTAGQLSNTLSNMGSRIAPSIQNANNRANEAAHFYNANVSPLLKSVGYKPEDVMHDAGALATGNADKIKGPQWAGNMKMENLPFGASQPRPLEMWKSLYGSAAGMLPNSGSQAGTAMAHAGMQ